VPIGANRKQLVPIETKTRSWISFVRHLRENLQMIHRHGSVNTVRVLKGQKKLLPCLYPSQGLLGLK
jgi:hypothetical protein